MASGNAEGLQGLASAIRSISETLGAYLPWPLADPTVALGADISNIIGLQPEWAGVGRLLVSRLALCWQQETLVIQPQQQLSACHMSHFIV